MSRWVLDDGDGHQVTLAQAMVSLIMLALMLGAAGLGIWILTRVLSALAS